MEASLLLGEHGITLHRGDLATSGVGIVAQVCLATQLSPDSQVSVAGLQRLSESGGEPSAWLMATPVAVARGRGGTVCAELFNISICDFPAKVKTQ